MRYLVDGPEKKVIVVMPAYNASRTLKATLDEIPQGCFDEIILVDDASKDDTVERARELIETVVVHPHNRGYGGNQKTCYRTALDHGADIIVMVHPDNQYNPKLIPNMVLPIYLGQADVVLASRFIQDPLRGGPVAGGMPLLKYFVNRGMTTVQNWLMGTFFSEFHTGYRAFSRQVLEEVDLESLSDDYLFDNQILAVLIERRVRFTQIGVETRYFPEAHTINLRRGIVYAAGCMGVAWRYFLHRKGWKTWPLVARKPKP
jgi:glycosyltransferase involved in cell wall biosynthesis